jgi:hypothetical protein
MVSDYFTKPLQGTAFRKLRQLIMNTDETESGPSETRRSVLEHEQEVQEVSHGSSPGQADPTKKQRVKWGDVRAAVESHPSG